MKVNTRFKFFRAEVQINELPATYTGTTVGGWSPTPKIEGQSPRLPTFVAIQRMSGGVDASGTPHRIYIRASSKSHAWPGGEGRKVQYKQGGSDPGFGCTLKFGFNHKWFNFPTP